MENSKVAMNQSGNLRVALVHDFLVQYGGAERVLEVMCGMFPEAPVYTLLHDREKMRGKFSGKEIRTSFLQSFPKFLRKKYKYLLPFMPTAPETFDLRDFDLVISSSGAWSKGIVTRVNTVHVSYLHSPMRFVWDANEEYLRQQEKSKAINFFSRLLTNYLRVWDKAASDRPDHLIANSKYTQARIKKYYGRESVVIYPPVDMSFRADPALAGGAEESTQNKIPSALSKVGPSTLSAADFARDDNTGRYFLIVSRLAPYKNIDKVIEAFNKLELPLIVIGEGSQEKYLKKISGPNVRVLGWQSDEKIQEYYSNARAFIFAGVDDFGLSPVEAMAHGVPVIAIRKGGAMETVLEGETGEFFDAASSEVIADAIRRFRENEEKYDREAIMDRAKKFGKERFRTEFMEFINSVISKSKITNPK